MNTTNSLVDARSLLPECKAAVLLLSHRSQVFMKVSYASSLLRALILEAQSTVNPLCDLEHQVVMLSHEN